MPPRDILEPSAGDTSIAMLDTLFGSDWDAYLTGGPVGGAGTVLFELLGALNTVVLAATSILIVYVMAVGVMGTAHEGEALGKRYSTLWTPLRSAFSIAMLAPIAGGLSIFQAILLALTWMGIGGADYLTTKAADYMADHGGTLVTRPAADSQIYDVARGILYTETIQQYQVLKLRRRIGAVYDVVWKDDSWLPGWMGGGTDGRWIFRFHGGDGLGLDPGEMGTVSISCTSPRDGLCTATRDAMGKLIVDLLPVSMKVVSTERPDLNLVRAAVAKYLAAHRTAVAAVVRDGDVEYDRSLRDLRDKMHDGGWVKLGQWYWVLAHANETINARVNAPVAYGEPDAAKLATASYGDLKGYLDRYRVWTIGVPLGDADVSAAVSSEDHGIMDAISDYLSKPVAAIVDMTVDKLTVADPVASLQDVGHYMIDVAWGIYVASVLARAGLETAGGDAGGKDSSIIDTGASKVRQILFGGVKSIGEDILEVGKNTMIPLMVGGAALAFYLPAIPFILWTLAVIGWMIMVAESLVAAPLWVAAHAIPEGEGLTGQHGKQGYMLFLGVLLRPPLMVIGYFVAWIGIYAIGKFIGETLKIFFVGLNSGSLSGLITVISLIFIVGGLVIFAAHKVFSLITWLPDNVLRWIGQHVQSLGETHDERRIAGAIGGSFGKMESAAKGATGGGAAAQGGAKQAEQAQAAAQQHEAEAIHQLGDTQRALGDPKSD